MGFKESVIRILDPILLLPVLFEVSRPSQLCVSKGGLQHLGGKDTDAKARPALPNNRDWREASGLRSNVRSGRIGGLLAFGHHCFPTGAPFPCL